MSLVLRLKALAVAGLILFAACGDATTSSVVTITFPEEPVDADVPAEYLDAVVAEVAASSGVAPAEVAVLDATAVSWGDQRLGCVHLPAPEQPEPVEGYRVVVDTGSTQFDYRLDASGTPYLCGDPISDPEGEDEHDEHDEPEEASS